MNGRRDYYQVLGVPRDADAKASSRRSASWPAAITRDTSTEPDAQQRFAEIAKAYAVLSDPAKRASYDAHGFAGLSGASAEDLWGGIDFATSSDPAYPGSVACSSHTSLDRGRPLGQRQAPTLLRRPRPGR